MNISLRRRSADEIAQRVVQDIPEGAHVNLGIGMPMKISNHLPKDREILLQSENGLLGMGPLSIFACWERLKFQSTAILLIGAPTEMMRYRRLEGQWIWHMAPNASM